MKQMIPLLVIVLFLTGCKCQEETSFPQEQLTHPHRIVVTKGDFLREFEQGGEEYFGVFSAIEKNWWLGGKPEGSSLRHRLEAPIRILGKYSREDIKEDTENTENTENTKGAMIIAENEDFWDKSNVYQFYYDGEIVPILEELCND